MGKNSNGKTAGRQVNTPVSTDAANIPAAGAAVVDPLATATPDPLPVIPGDKDILDNNNEINEEGQTNTSPLDEYMQPYLSAYPDEIVFFIATDGHVFLSSAENDARYHQRKLDHTRELIEYFRG